MVKMNNNNTLQQKLLQQQQHQHCVKDKTAKQKSTKRAANMSYTNSTETITVTIAQEQTTTTTAAAAAAAAAANQCMATRWSTVTTSIPAPTTTPTPMTTTTTTTTTKTASSATIYRKYDNNSGTRWTLGIGDTQMKLPWLLLLLITTTATAEKRAQEAHGSHSRAATKYSQPLVATSADNDDSFRPIIPKDISPEYISRNVFTETGQYRVFQSVSSKADVDNERLEHSSKTTAEQTTLQPAVATVVTASTTMATSATTTKTRIQKASTTQRSGTGVLAVMAQKTQPSTEYRAAPDQPKRKHEPMAAPAAGLSNALSSEMKGLEELLVEYVQNFFNKGQYEPLPGLVFALHNNHTDDSATVDVGKRKTRPVRQLAATPKLGAANAGGSIRINIPRAVESGRLFFFSGLKKILWPIFMGLQILKSLLFAMFLPTLIGSFGKLLGKGIVSGSSPLFIRPAETPQDLDFRDNTFNFDDDNKFGANDESGNAYNQAEASQTQNQYVYNPAAINQQALSRYGNEQSKMQDSYLSALQSISSASFKNSNSISGSSSAAGGGGLGTPLRTKPAAPANTNTYQTFQKVPASSLLLSNYDPFYSPLLSRLDSVFAQLKLNSESESCREKLICLMYANPAKYAPYSNLVSAQLSRELNELRKPTSDNPDILRFFKYMRAAKDGQDGVDCEKSFDRCKEFKDFENPAMVSTYHDINKLVQARKLA